MDDIKWKLYIMIKYIIFVIWYFFNKWYMFNIINLFFKVIDILVVRVFCKYCII